MAQITLMAQITRSYGKYFDENLHGGVKKNVARTLLKTLNNLEFVKYLNKKISIETLYHLNFAILKFQRPIFMLYSSKVLNPHLLFNIYVSSYRHKFNDSKTFLLQMV